DRFRSMVADPSKTVPAVDEAGEFGGCEIVIAGHGRQVDVVSGHDPVANVEVTIVDAFLGVGVTLDVKTDFATPQFVELGDIQPNDLVVIFGEPLRSPSDLAFSDWTVDYHLALGYCFDGLLLFFNLFSSQPRPEMRIDASKSVQCPEESDELLG